MQSETPNTRIGGSLTQAITPKISNAPLCPVDSPKKKLEVARVNKVTNFKLGLSGKSQKG